MMDGIIAVETIAKVRALHLPSKIYRKCEHSHIEDEERTGRAFNVADVGLTCDEGYWYSICENCCLDDYFERTEDCEGCHAHAENSPICRTIDILDTGETK